MKYSSISERDVFTQQQFDVSHIFSAAVLWLAHYAYPVKSFVIVQFGSLIYALRPTGAHHDTSSGHADTEQHDFLPSAFYVAHGTCIDTAYETSSVFLNNRL